MTQKCSKWRASAICACFVLWRQAIAKNKKVGLGPEGWNGMPKTGVLFDL